MKDLGYTPDEIINRKSIVTANNHSNTCFKKTSLCQIPTDVTTIIDSTFVCLENARDSVVI